MKIGICDDDVKAQNLVFSWLEKRSEIVERNVFGFNCGAALLEHLRFSDLDLIFLDCQMEGIDGIETAKLIRKNNKKVVIILLTDFVYYARFGYGANIFEYILKQEFQGQIEKIYNRAVKHIQSSDIKTYAVKTKSGLFQLNIADILYVECHGRKKEFFTVGNKSYEFNGRIDDIEKELSKYGFIRPHKSYLVNSSYIRIFKPNNVWLAELDMPLPVSRSKYKQAYNDMTVYATEVHL